MRRHVLFLVCASLVALWLAALAGGCSAEVLPVGIEALDLGDATAPVDSAASSDSGSPRDATGADTSSHDASPDTHEQDVASDTHTADASVDATEDKDQADSGSPETGADGADASLGDTSSATGDGSGSDSSADDAADAQPDTPSDSAPSDGHAGQTYTIGGTVSGLANPESLQLSDGAQVTFVGTNGSFAFPPVPDGTPYTVTVVANPTTPVSQTCTVAMGTGTVMGANVTNVAVSCKTNTFTVGGTVMGLTSIQSVTLLDNGTDSLMVVGDGTFTFLTAIASGSPYAVTVSSSATLGQACTVKPGTGSGTIGSTNVTNVVVQCGPSLGGTVVGLVQGASMVLQDSGLGSIPLMGTPSGTQTFTFPAPLGVGQTYDVSVLTPPSGETCIVHNGSGTAPAEGVANVQVVCGYMITVAVSGLSGNTSLTLTDGMGTFSNSVPAAIDGTYMLGPLPPPSSTNLMYTIGWTATPAATCVVVPQNQQTGILMTNIAVMLVCS